MIWILIAISLLAVGEVAIMAYLIQLFGTLEEYLTNVTEELNYIKSVCKRVQASRERGADVTGLRRRVEALEKDIEDVVNP
jgi:hypothetical protein